MSRSPRRTATRLTSVLAAACFVTFAFAPAGGAGQSPASEAPQDPVASYETFAKLSPDNHVWSVEKIVALFS